MKKWFKVAQSGATIDGRKIEAQWLLDAAESYDPAIYGARINNGHIFSYSLDDDNNFPALGDVTALKAEKNGDVVSLFAEIDPTDRLIKLTNARQKVFTSIELIPEFADTGKAYVYGLAVTDNPASLGTQMLSFCANSEGFAGKEILKGKHYSDDLEIEMSFEDESNFFESIKQKYLAFSEKTYQSVDDCKQAIDGLADETLKGFTAQNKAQDVLRKEFSDLHAKHTKLQSDHQALSEKFTKLDTFFSQANPAQPDRPSASGTSNLPNC